MQKLLGMLAVVLTALSLSACSMPGPYDDEGLSSDDTSMQSSGDEISDLLARSDAQEGHSAAWQSRVAVSSNDREIAEKMEYLLEKNARKLHIRRIIPVTDTPYVIVRVLLCDRDGATRLCMNVQYHDHGKRVVHAGIIRGYAVRGHLDRDSRQVLRMAFQKEHRAQGRFLDFVDESLAEIQKGS